MQEVQTFRRLGVPSTVARPALDVRIPAAAGAAVRERDVVAEARPLAADVADGSHGSLHWVKRLDSPRGSGSRRSLPEARPLREPTALSPILSPAFYAARCDHAPRTARPGAGPQDRQGAPDRPRPRTVGDLLRHYPRRYYSRGELTDLSSLREGDHVTVLARVDHVSVYPMPNRNFRARGEVIITDDRAKLMLTFFFRTTRAENGFQRRSRARHGRHVRGHGVQLPGPAPAGPPGVRAAARGVAQRRPDSGAGRRVRQRADPRLPGHRQGQLVDHRQVDHGPSSNPWTRAPIRFPKSCGNGTGCTAGPRPSGPSTGRWTGRTGTGPASGSSGTRPSCCRPRWRSGG